jgi:hypothetical protein
MADRAGPPGEPLVIGVRCPTCHYPITGAAESISGVDVARPPEGALSICLACGSLSRFTAGGDLVPIPRREVERLVLDPQVRELVLARTVVVSSDGSSMSKPVWPAPD